MAKKMRRMFVLCMVLAFSISALTVPAMASDLSISDKTEITNQENVSLDGYNALVVKQSNGTIIWVEDENDKGNQEVIDKILQADPSIKDTYVVVSGEDTFHFGDYFEGKQYEKTSITIGEEGARIDGDYSHASPFAYTKGEPQETEPKETEPKETEPKETEPKETEPKETEPQETEPKETEPKETEPKETEPKETEPKETEPKETEPKETEPKETEPKETEPKETEPKETEPKETEPKETEPKPTKPGNPGVPVVLNDEIEIPDEEVPLASAPKTGDISLIWIALSGLSAGGMVVLGKKREEDEE